MIFVYTTSYSHYMQTHQCMCVLCSLWIWCVSMRTCVYACRVRVCRRESKAIKRSVFRLTNKQHRVSYTLFASFAHSPPVGYWWMCIHHSTLYRRVVVVLEKRQAENTIHVLSTIHICIHQLSQHSVVNCSPFIVLKYKLRMKLWAHRDYFMFFGIVPYGLCVWYLYRIFTRFYSRRTSADGWYFLLSGVCYTYLQFV